MYLMSGKKGKVLKVIRKENKLIVEGVNIRKRHNKDTGVGQKSPGGYWFGPSPVQYASVALLDPTTGKPTKVSTRIEEKEVDGKKVLIKYRVARKSGAVIEKQPPQINLEKRKRVSPMDTKPVAALKKTFNPDTLNPLKTASLEHKEVFLQEE